MIGINPGLSSEPERRFYRERGPTYKAVVEYWKKNICARPYYKRLRAFADEVGLGRSILWTELVKCESKKRTNLSVQTIRADIHRYLFREIKNIPDNWPLIGAGTRAYEILSFSFPERTIIGLPHPTGSFGQYTRLMKNGRLKTEAQRIVMDVLKKSDSTCRSFKFKEREWKFQ